MPDDAKFDAVGVSLDQALLKMQSLEDRLKSGEDVSDDELDEIAKQVAHGLEDALDTLKSLVGEEQQVEIEQEMIARMSDEEFREWSENFPARQAFRMQRQQDKLAKLNG